MNKDNGLLQQQGAVFVTGLIFLVVITLLGVTAMKTANLEERMAGNLRDRNLALQAAEMGLRYAERHITANNIANPINDGNLAGFGTTCPNGLCYFDVTNAKPPNAWDTYCTPNCPINYVAGTEFISDRTYTAPDLPADVPAPTYLIEAIERNVPGFDDPLLLYRITVRAQGAKAGTVVNLQEVYRP